MGTFGGGGADNLDFSSHTYEELRAAVFGLSEEAIRVAGNEWADLKRRLHERVGTLHVTVAKLEPLWDSPAGQLGLEAFRRQRDWMSELARVAGINEAHMDDVQAARTAAVRAMRALDAQPGGPARPGGRSRPAPSPGPAVGDWVDPATLDWRQPHAAQIARQVYGRLAVAAASMAAPPRDMDVLVGSPLGDERTAGEGRTPTVGAASVRDAGSGDLGGQGTGGGTAGAQTPVAGGPGLRRPPQAGLTPESSAGVTAHGFRAVPGSAGVPDETSPVAGASLRGAGGSRRGGVLGGRLNSAAATVPPGVSQPLGRVLGGGRRPPPGVPAQPATPSTVPPSRTGRRDDRRGGGKPGYERADPDTFVDKRPANTAGGRIATPEEPGGFPPLPGAVGGRTAKPAGADRQHTSQVGPSLAGFPDSLETFTRHDGAQFEVRRVPGGS